MTFYADTLYWIEETKRSQDYTLRWIDTSRKSSDDPRQYRIQKNHDRPLTIETILARAPQIGWSRCQMKDNCPGLCVTTPTSQSQRPRSEPVYDSECVCPSHFKLTESESGQITGQTKCSPPSDFLLFSRSRSISRMVKDKLLDKAGFQNDIFLVTLFCHQNFEIVTILKTNLSTIKNSISIKLFQSVKLIRRKRFNGILEIGESIG